MASASASASTLRGEIRGRIDQLNAEIDERIKQYQQHTHWANPLPPSSPYLELLRDELDELQQRRRAEERMLDKLRGQT